MALAAQRYISRHNAIATVITASSVRASTAMERILAVRDGGGRIRLAGAYTGHEAVDIDVEITSATGLPRASKPVFSGVGSGTIDISNVTGVAPLQEWTLTLDDLGVATERAWLDVREVQLVAAVTGSAGNAVKVSVTPNLTRSATSHSLLTNWNANTLTQTGEQWDFGAAPINSKGEINETTTRIQFGNDPEVYRQWREYKDGAWRYGLSPDLQRDVPSGTPVYTVSGGYVVTITDGSTTETYGNTQATPPQAPIVTFYDLLTALAGSTLVKVSGVIAADRTPNGQAVIDVPLRTTAWLHGVDGLKLDAVTVPGGAPTQAVTVKCVNNDIAGQERWSVVGDVSGALPAAITGQPYTSTAASFTIPQAPDLAAVNGDWSFKYRSASRDEEEGEPAVCLRPFRFGANARAKTVTFRYRKRPPADCDCSNMPAIRLSDKCLGLSLEDDMALDPAYQTRLESLYEWRRDFHAANWVKYYVPPKDLDFADAITEIFADALAEIHTSSDARTEWDSALTSMETDLQPLESEDFDDKLSGGNLWNAASQTGAARLTAVGDAISEIPDKVDDNGHGALPVTGTLSFDVANLVRKYRARMDYCRALAGIVPKSDASSAEAGDCWRDLGGSHWWEDVDGKYLPAFTNEAYVSARRDERGKPYSTKEFGFGLVVACADRLKEGDEITIRIDAVDGDAPYAIGDSATIRTVGAGAAKLAGGIDGTDELTWRVVTSAGVQTAYTVPTDGSAPQDYTAQGVTLKIKIGGIPFALGDQFVFSVEAGQYRWRRVGQGWSAAADIPVGGVAALADGIDVHFDAGAAPSFVMGDMYSFRVHQPWAASHVQNAGPSVWGWTGATATMTLDLSSIKDVTAIALARYDLKGGGASFELSDDGSTWGSPQALDTGGPVAVELVDEKTRYVRISVSGATDGHIGWIYVGKPWTTQYSASTCVRRRAWAVERGQSINPRSLYAGSGDGWELEWAFAAANENSSMLERADVDGLVSLLDFAQRNDEPLIFVPHKNYPQEASLVRFAEDAMEVSEEHAYQWCDRDNRQLSARLQLDPVLR